MTSFFVSIVVHELGHALVAIALGARPTELTFGSGRRLVGFSVGTTRFVLRPNPWDQGYAALRFRRPGLLRLRFVVVLLAGWSAQGLFAFGIMALDRAVDPQNLVVDLALRVFAWSTLAATILALGNLLPITLSSGITDGMLIRQTLGSTEEEMSAILIPTANQRALQDISFAIDDADFETADLMLAQWSESLESQNQPHHPEAWTFHSLRSYVLIQMVRYEDAAISSGTLVDWIEAGDEDITCCDTHRSQFFGTHAYVLALLGRDLDTAVELAARSWKHDKGPSVRGTIGAILVQRQSPAKGVDFLQRALQVARHPADVFETHRFLAIGYERLGDRQTSERHQAAAKRARPDLAYRLNQ